MKFIKHPITGRLTLNPLILVVLLSAIFTSPVKADSVQYHIVVAPDGKGDFTSIQSAIDNTKSFPDKRITIEIKPGVYQEKIIVPEWNPKVSLIGEDANTTRIVYGDYFDKINRGRNSTFFTATLQVNGNDFHMENITVENSAGSVGQALALAVNADRATFYNSRFIGNQDTVYVSGEGKRQYFKNCYIEGTTDFIFGGATAVFEQCQIHAKADSYITAASTPAIIDYGLTFIDCDITAAKGVNKVYLGRPWRPFARVVFINTKMDGAVPPEGWHNWNNPTAEKSSFFAEFGSRGAGAPKSGKRVEWSHQLSANQVSAYTPEKILRPNQESAWYKRSQK